MSGAQPAALEPPPLLAAAAAGRAAAGRPPLAAAPAAATRCRCMGGGVALQVYGVVVLTDVPLQASVRSLAVAGRCLLRVRVG